MAYFNQDQREADTKGRGSRDFFVKDLSLAEGPQRNQRGGAGNAGPDVRAREIRTQKPLKACAFPVRCT